jgi:hypothetical protein
MHYSIFRFTLAINSTLYILETVGLRLSTRYIREFSVFSVCFFSKNCLSARCAAAAACRDGDVFGTRTVSLVSRDSSVGIATAYGLDDRGVGVLVPVGSRIFSTSSRPALGPTQPRIPWVSGVFPPGVKQQWREDDQSPPATADVKKMWIYTSTSLYAFMA